MVIGMKDLFPKYVSTSPQDFGVRLRAYSTLWKSLGTTPRSPTSQCVTNDRVEHQTRDAHEPHAGG